MENKLPITRLSKFFSQEDFDLDIQLGQEYLHGDLNMKLILYRVDKTRTETDDVYAESGKDEIVFFPPIEINALVKVNSPTNSSYTNGMVRYLEPGNLEFYIYIKHLNDLQTDIILGDYIGYQESENKMRYYVVTNDGRVTSDNRHKHFGYKPYYRTIMCVPVQENEFRGI